MYYGDYPVRVMDFVGPQILPIDDLYSVRYDEALNDLTVESHPSMEQLNHSSRHYYGKSLFVTAVDKLTRDVPADTLAIGTPPAIDHSLRNSGVKSWSHEFGFAAKWMEPRLRSTTQKRAIRRGRSLILSTHEA